MAEVPHAAALDVICGFAMRIFKTDAMYVGLPTSMSYICIINIPFFEDNTCTQRVSLDCIKGALARSPLHEHFILARDPRLVRNSPNSTNCTVNIDLWDSQTGARAKALIGKSLMMGNRLCLIKEAQLMQLSQSALTRPTVLIVAVLIVQTRANASSGTTGLTSNGSMPSMLRYVNVVLMLDLTLITFLP